MVTLWCASNLSLIPRKICKASFTLGSFKVMGWNLLCKAASFSKYLRYSLRVVAPMVCNSPLARAGLRMFAASILPSLAPAPTMVWISSINKIIFPLFLTSSITFLSLSSNSPRYFAPAIKALISRAMTRLFCKDIGTSFFTILCASPSTTAVFPTPGSPSKIGLFFVLRIRICIIWVISSSLPITGSSLPSMAFWVKSMPNFSSDSKFSSPLCESIFAPARIVSKVLFSSLISKYLLKSCLIESCCNALRIKVSSAI